MLLAADSDTILQTVDFREILVRTDTPRGINRQCSRCDLSVCLYISLDYSNAASGCLLLSVKTLSFCVQHHVQRKDSETGDQRNGMQGMSCTTRFYLFM